MSEPGPESVPTSADPRSQRPTKRRAVTPHSEQAAEIDSLLKDPSKEVQLPGASKLRTAASIGAPPEIVANVQGSSAGAGSGEFHVYKASRRREYERLRLMQSEVDKEKNDAEWEKDREATKKKDEEKTDKNRRRREKKRAARSNKKDDSGKMDVDGKASKPSIAGPRPPVAGSGDSAADAHEQQKEAAGVIIHDDD